MTSISKQQKDGNSDRMSIGRVVAIWRYPVKSMAGESLEHVDVSWFGLAGDRRWAFVRGGVERSGFPWLTIRQRPEMSQYKAWFKDPNNPNTSATMVRTPTGEEFDVIEPELAEILGGNVHTIKQDRGIFDTFPLSLITTDTVNQLSHIVGAELDVQRFRPNLLIEPVSSARFPEDEWVGRDLQIGDSVMRVDKRDGRCSVVNIDPTTSQMDSSVLRAIANNRDDCLGVYGSTISPGRIAVGDHVYFDG